MTNKGSNPITEEEVQDLLQEFDADEDGCINREGTSRNVQHDTAC